MREQVFITEYPVELAGKVDPVLYRRLEQIFRKLQELSLFQREVPAVAQRVVKQQLQLLGVLREPLVGQETTDPSLTAAATVPGSLTDLTGVGGTNITVTVTTTGPGNSGRNITIDISNDPVFNTVNVTGHYKVDGVQVVSNQGAAIPDAILGTEIATINLILAFLRSWGAIAT